MILRCPSFPSVLLTLCASCPASVASGEDTVAPATFRVQPTDIRLNGELDRVQLVVTSCDDIDITGDVVFESRTPEVSSVSSPGRVAPHANGTGIIRVTFMNDTVEIPVSVTNIDSRHPVSFTEHVLPALTKSGCNQGACHGGQFGQGGFRLSLLGFAPEQDFVSIVRDTQQRRVSLVSPKDSLILQKAILSVPHGGGRRISPDSVEFQTLRTWIEGGAVESSPTDAAVTDITVIPNEHEYRENENRQLQVIAVYSDGTQRDVTHLARYDSLGTGIASVTRDGYITSQGKGQTAIMVRYRGLAEVSSVVRPFAEHVEFTDFEPQNFVDEHVLSRWRKLGLQPSPICNDETFIRRAFLASIGTLPSAECVYRFLESQQPNKRAVLVDELLGLTGDPKRDVYIEPWSAYWTQKWGDLLRNNRDTVGITGMWAFSNWIRAALRQNKPMDEFVREILMAQGSIYQNGQANFYKVSDNPTDLAEITAQVFLGVRLQCAKCHQHPFESYSQSDYYGLAAFFTQVTTKRSSDFGVFGEEVVVSLRTSGSIKHPRSGQVVPPSPLGTAKVEWQKARDLRRPLAEWLTSQENPLFARNIVNRTWGYLMGTALVEPIDDLRATNPPSNPELLDALAEDFVRNGHDLKKLMRAIMTSRVFQLTSTTTESNAGDTQFFSHYPTVRLPAEVMLDAIDFVCGTQERFAGVPLGTRAIELPDPNFESYFLDTLGRPRRIVSCECERTAEPNLAQVLQLANGELVQRKLADQTGRISSQIDEQKSDDAICDEFYVVALSRHPTQEELNNCHSIISAAADRRSGLEDVLWAILNGREFLFNH